MVGSGRRNDALLTGPKKARLMNDDQSCTGGRMAIADEMRKRRERIEKWRAKRNSDGFIPATVIEKVVQEEIEKPQDGQSDGHEIIKKDEDSEIDPLDAYMASIAEEVRNAIQLKSANTISNKGDIMEQDADALEYDIPVEEEDDMSMWMDRKSKADSIVADHDRIYYRKFRKDFYVEVPELAKMSSAEVTAYREELGKIRVKGRNVPKPIKHWAQCVTFVSILDTLKRAGMDRPTPIQAQSLPVIASGRDMLGIAKTGSGKTLGFLLPMLRHIKSQPRLEPDDGPIGLILTPTRELAMQISKECRRFTRQLDMRCVAVYGGTGISEQIAELKRGSEIVVCTPGRMIDMLAANNGKVTNLRRVTYVVLDEADRMFDLGFEPQVSKILECIRPDRQTVMFSATFPRQMEALARRALTKPIEVVVGGRSVVCGDVEQQVIVLNEHEKYLKLLELLGLYQEHGSVLVFVHKQEHADELMKNLLQNSYSCMSLHGGLDQYDRDSVITDFKSGVIRLLVATSVAARGLDVKDLVLVVNYDCPNHYEDYIHRCGRTGRAGNKGTAFTFMTPGQERFAGDIIYALEQSGAEVSDELRSMWTSYVQKLKEEGLELPKHSSVNKGFSGRGFKFDREEESFSDNRKRVQRAMFNLNDSDDDEEDNFDMDKEIERVFKSKTRVKEETEAGNVLAPGTVVAPCSSDRATINEKLAAARKVAASIQSLRIMKDTSSSSVIAPPLATANQLASMPTINLVSKSIAEQIGQKLNNRLNYVPKNNTCTDGQTDEKVFYEEQLEINDFPQQVRWKITSKDTLSHIAEYADVGIAIRGKYFAPGKNVTGGESKLYITVDALSDRSLQLAKAEIRRIIKEEMMKLQNPALQLVNRGRYKVV